MAAIPKFAPVPETVFIFEVGLRLERVRNGVAEVKPCGGSPDVISHSCDVQHQRVDVAVNVKSRLFTWFLYNVKFGQGTEVTASTVAETVFRRTIML